MRYYEAEASIDAPVATVWEILTDAEGLTTWDSGVERFEGAVELGRKVKLYSEVSPGRAFPLKVIEFDAHWRMVWQGGMPFGLFRGTRTFTLSESGEVTQFKMREEFTGPLVGLIWNSMPDLGPSFAKFANGLKQRAEAQSREESQ